MNRNLLIITIIVALIFMIKEKSLELNGKKSIFKNFLLNKLIKKRGINGNNGKIIYY